MYQISKTSVALWALGLVMLLALVYMPKAASWLRFADLAVVQPITPKVIEQSNSIKQQSTSTQTRSATRNTRTNRVTSTKTYYPSGAIKSETVITSNTESVRQDTQSSVSTTNLVQLRTSSNNSGVGMGIIANPKGVGVGISQEVAQVGPIGIQGNLGVVQNPIDRSIAPSLGISANVRPAPNLSISVGPVITGNTPLGYNMGPVGITGQIGLEYRF